MTDTGSAAVQPGAPVAPAAQPAPSPSQVPAGYSLVSEADLNAYKRHSEQVRGFEPFRQRLEKSGIKSVDDWAKHEPDFQTLSKRGLKPGALAAMFTEEADEDVGAGAKPQSIDVDALRKQIEDGVMGKYEERVHTEARKGDDKVIEAAFSKVAGEDADDFNKELVKRAVKDWLEENRPTYPAGHPLAEKFLAPLSPALAEKAVEYFTGLKAKQKGADMAATASAANAGAKPKVGSVAGGGTSVPPGKETTKQSAMRPGGVPNRAEVEAYAATLRAKRQSG